MQGVMHVMDRSGHTTYPWDTERPTGLGRGGLDPAYVEREFKRLVGQMGYRAVGTTAKDEHVLLRSSEFDPETYPKVTLSPQLVGG